jgi:transglutaminase-like putative cysteine protease
MSLSRHMVDYMRQQFIYRAREVERTQEPHETLGWRSGTCRDYAWLMIEAVRWLGLAARFVSGYFYDPALDGRPSRGQEAAARTPG